MLGYIFVFLTLLCSVGKGFFGKLTSNKVITIKDGMLLNFTRMSLCVLIGLIVSIITYKGFSFLVIPSSILIITIVSGISISLFVINWVFAVQKGAFSLVDVFINIGVIIPILLTHFIYKEAIKWTQWLGIGILFGASFVMCRYSSKTKSKITAFELMLLIMIAISNGVFLFAQKWFVHEVANASINVDSSVYNLYTYIFATLIFFVLFVSLTIHNKLHKIKEERNNNWIIKLLPIIASLALCFFMYSYLLTKAASMLNAILLYPLVQGVSLILSNLMAAIAFNEKINKRSVFGITLTIIAVLIINLL